MDTRTLIVTTSRSRRIAAAAVFLITTLAAGRVYAEFGTQLVPFFFPDGSEVLSVNGEPDDAVLNRFFDTQKDRINWQLMTQHLNSGEEYEIWLEGSNDETDWFSWWVGSAKANPRGNLNAIGTVYAEVPPGPAYGVFVNPRARANLVIKTTDGIIMQTAYFPAF